jgi:DNA polymerase III epsilon subunit-like protein
MKEQEIFFSVDIEASGPIPGEYSMLSLGACLVQAVDHTFYAELRPISDHFVPAALEVAGFDLRELYRSGKQPVTVMQNLLDWVAAESQGVCPVFVGFNAGFDWSFVNWYFHKFLGKNPFGAAPLDIKAYYMGLSGCSWEETRSSKLPEIVRPVPVDKKHNALSDAVYQAGIFRRVMDFRTQILRCQSI